MLLLVALELDTGEHGKALVGNTLLEVIVGVQVLFSRFFALSWHFNGLSGDSINQMS